MDFPIYHSDFINYEALGISDDIISLNESKSIKLMHIIGISIVTVLHKRNDLIILIELAQQLANSSFQIETFK